MTVEITAKKGGARVVGSGGGGKGGGGSARTPVESPDSLRNTAYAVVLDAIGNGELAGPVHPSQPMRDIYLDGTPLQNADGSMNFERVEVEYRLGLNDQAHIAGFPVSSSVTNVNVEVRAVQPWTQAITNTELSALRITLTAPQLVQQVESGSNLGDRIGVFVEYAIDLSTAGGSFLEVLRSSFDGKNINGYSRTHRVELPQSSSGWTVRVRRITADNTSSAIQDRFSVGSYAEVIDGKFVYPMTALVGVKIDAEQFRSIPTRAYHWRGKIIRVPSNYDPEARTYSGIWDGTFKRAWSNNPAWVYYDMLTNKLGGLGERIDPGMVDRYALYQIAVYCDQMVPDGQGGMEPRFACNVYIQAQADALRVLNDLTSIFRGMSFWANNQVVTKADAPADPVYTYTNANVVEGRFEYVGSDSSTVKTVALVSWNDPTDFGRSKVVVVEDRQGIERYGIRKTELVAFGCTSRGQAQRVGLYHLYTSRMDSGGVNFSVGLDGVIPNPGDLIQIADKNRAGRNIGGRIKSATATAVTLDRDSFAKPGDQLVVNLPSGQRAARTVVSVSGRTVSVSPAFPELPAHQAVWALEADDLKMQTARIVSIKEREGITFNIEAILQDPRKHSAIDSGARLDPLPISVVPPRAQLAPTNVVITQHHTFHQGTTRHRAEITFTAPENGVEYDVQWRRDNSEWVQVPRTSTKLVEIPDIFAGEYLVRVRALNALGVPSLWAYSEKTRLDGLIGEPPSLQAMFTTPELFGIRVSWIYPNTPNIISKVELRASHTNSFVDSLVLPDTAYPAASLTVGGLGYGTERWFWARLVDKNGLGGDWFPSESGPGIYGVSSIDTTALLEALAGKINEGSLAPGLAQEIAEQAAQGVVEEIVGDLTGDDVLDEKWYTGDEDEEGIFVGTVTTTSAYNAGDYYQAKRTTSLVAQFDTSLAVIRDVMVVQASETAALAQRVSTTAAQVDEMEAVVEQSTEALAELDGALRASWQVKTQVRSSDGRVAWTGMAQGAAINPDGTVRSEIILAANIVAIAATADGPLHYPFIFDTVNQTAIFNAGLFGTATIGFAKIANDIQSTNYVASQTGWRLDKNGNFFNNGTGAGGRRVDTSMLTTIFYPNGNTCLRLGIW